MEYLLIIIFVLAFSAGYLLEKHFSKTKEIKKEIIDENMYEMVRVAIDNNIRKNTEGEFIPRELFTEEKISKIRVEAKNMLKIYLENVLLKEKRPSGENIAKYCSNICDAVTIVQTYDLYDYMKEKKSELLEKYKNETDLYVKLLEKDLKTILDICQTGDDEIVKIWLLCMFEDDSYSKFETEIAKIEKEVDERYEETCSIANEVMNQAINELGIEEISKIEFEEEMRIETIDYRARKKMKKQTNIDEEDKKYLLNYARSYILTEKFKIHNYIEENYNEDVNDYLSYEAYKYKYLCRTIDESFILGKFNDLSREEKKKYLVDKTLEGISIIERKDLDTIKKSVLSN